MPVQVNDSFYHLLLSSLERATFKDFEVILVYDGWQGRLGLSQVKLNLTEIHNPKQSGPTFCRNFGASKATGIYLCFCDSDTEHHANTLELAVQHLQKESLDGLIGCYDRSPSCPSKISQFRNLLHAYHHEKNHNHQGVFWGAFGLIKNDAFKKVAGFNAAKYANPSIEDIELGYRLQAAGYKVKLKADVKLKHHKCWSFRNMVRTDLFARAIPWTKLLNETNNWSNAKLNTTWREKVSAVLAVLMPTVFLAFGIYFSLFTFVVFLFLLVAQIAIQKGVYLFFAKQLGYHYFMFFFFMHQVYLLIAVLGFIFGHLKKPVSK